MPRNRLYSGVSGIELSARYTPNGRVKVIKKGRPTRWHDWHRFRQYKHPLSKP